MRLFFMRHAEAVERDDWKGEEADRPLTEKGERDTGKEARRLAEIGLQVGIILSSPLIRAMRTAEIIGAALKPPLKPLPDERLLPGFEGGALEQILEDWSELESILMVGHEPDLGLVVGELVSCSGIEFKKGALALVETVPDSDDAKLLWLIPQKILI
ncbi:MAG: phosphohistidine phosphatase SixA [Treponemataceae bacterium]